MLDRRKANRYSKHYPVKFGINKPLLSAFTEDISGHGLFLRTNILAPIGTRIVIDLSLPSNETVSIAGAVIWVEKANKANRTGMGIEINRFISGDESYRKHLAELLSVKTQQAILYCAA